MTHHAHLLIVDPQNDFCDLPIAYQPSDPLNDGYVLTPQLPVPGAHADMLRLAQLIRHGTDAIAGITMTLDSHHHIGIERPDFWLQRDGGPVAPFTRLSSADVRGGKFLPRNGAAKDKVLAYLNALEAAGRHIHTIWPVHCEIGTWGHNVHADVLAACNAWERHHCQPVMKVLKGSNPYTEHYSALMAEVPDPADAGTQLNRQLLESLASAQVLLVAGEAGSHCVQATMEHYAHYAGPDATAKVVLLTDCMSPIPGFETAYAAFLADMQRHGARLSTARAWLDGQAPVFRR